MEQALSFFRENETFIYLGFGLVAVWQFRKVLLSWSELRGAAFGLERESAQGRLNRAVSILVFVLVMSMFEFALVAYIVPNTPGAMPLFTPTLDLMASPSATLDDSALQPNGTPEPNLTLVVSPDADSNCVLDQVMILSPTDGDSVQDLVEIIGTANIPNFGFYKYETTNANEESWLTIQAGNTVVNQDQLGFWDTKRLVPGDYKLRLIVTDNEGQATAPCVIQVRVDPPTEE